jgi:hypothetical protein
LDNVGGGSGIRLDPPYNGYANDKAVGRHRGLPLRMRRVWR